MDYTISNNAALFDRALEILERYREEPGVGEALDDLNAAKVNYAQRSIDHMLNCLVLTAYDLFSRPLPPQLVTELRAVVYQYVQRALGAGSKMSDLAREYKEAGGRLLSDEEILREVDERRGTAR